MPAFLVGHDSNRVRIRLVARLESYATITKPPRRPPHWRLLAYANLELTASPAAPKMRPVHADVAQW